MCEDNLNVETLLRQRDELKKEIQILRTQLLQAGIVPLTSHSSTPDLTKTKRYSLPSYSNSVQNLEPKRQHSCVENRSCLTYDKRSGTSDLGKQYEYIMCAYYAIRLAISDHVTDFEMSTNDEVYGDFDDIVLKVNYVSNETHTYLFQLKHCENKKGLSEKILSSAEKKDFSLMKYFRTFQNLAQTDNLSCILFTNRTAYFKDFSQFCINDMDITVKEQKAVHFEDLFNTSQTKKPPVYQFSCQDPEICDFLNHFYLFANQNNVPKMKILISEILKQLLCCDIDDLFINFMKNWWGGNFILSKSDVIAKLAELTLSPCLMTISSSKSNAKSEMLAEAILDFDMTIVNDTDIVCDIWTKTDEMRQISITALKFGLTNKGTSSLEEMSNEQLSRVLWYLDKVPFIIKVLDNKKDQIMSAVRILEVLTPKKKLIIVGNFHKIDFPKWRVFDNLSDLSDIDTVTSNLEVSLQGRNPIPLQSLVSVDKAHIIKTKELLIMTQQPLLIGDKKTNLPQFYIPRSASTIYLDTEKVINHCLNSNEMLIIKCNVQFHDILKSRNHNFVHLSDFDIEPNLLIFVTSHCTKNRFDKIVQKSKKRVHLIKVINEDASILVLSSDNTLKPSTLQYHSEPINEKDIHDIFDNPINVLCAQPGIGKSTMIKYLDHNCPPNFWSVCVNLRKFNSLLKEEPEEEEILLTFLNLDNDTKDLLQQIKKIFYENRQIYLFLDGLDEIESNCVDFALDYVNYIASTGIHVWISSRQNLQDLIIHRLNVFYIDIEELNENEQKTYIKQRLQICYENDEIEQISKEIFYSADVANSHKVLGIPLQLYIITENFLNDVDLYKQLSEEHFVLTKMYKIFFDGKKKHLYEKVGVQYEQQLGFNFNSYLENYEIPALKCCLDDTAFARLNIELDCKHFAFLEMIKNEGDKFGIISHINDDKAMFTHLTYAEYFACLWLKKNFTKIRVLEEDLKLEKYQNLRLIFDIMLAENCPLHLAVIYRSSDQVRKHLSKIDFRDEGGRTPLHLICSYGSKYVPLQLEPSLYSNHLYHDENESNGETTEYQLIFNYLSNCSPFCKDQVFDWTALDYCCHFQNLYPIEKFLEMYKDKIKIDSLLNKLNSVSLIYYASKLGYTNLLETVIKRNKYVVHFKIGEAKLSFLHVAVKGVNDDYKVKDDTKIRIIKILVNNGIDINVKDKNGATILHWAVTKGCFYLVKALLDLGADVNSVDKKGNSILCYSLDKWQQRVDFFNIAKGGNFDTNLKDSDGCTILHWASQEGDYDLVKQLLDLGFGVNTRTNIEENCLHYAVKGLKPNLKLIKLLIDKGITVNAFDINGITPLQWAFDKRQYDVIAILHQNGADVNSINAEHKLLIEQYYENSMKILELLLKGVLDLNYKNYDDTTILHHIALIGHLNLFELLILNGANINARNKNKETVLHYAARGWNTRIVEVFKDFTTDVNAVDNSGTTALHRAAEQGHLKMVKALLKQGADINAVNDLGENVLILAIKSGEVELVQFLVDRGLDVDSKDQDGATALHFACEHGHVEIAKFLLDNGANVNNATKNNETPLHYTTSSQELVNLLVGSGVNINAADISGATALHKVVQRCQSDLVQVLLKHGADTNLLTVKKETALIYAVKQRKINLEVIKLLFSQSVVSAVDIKGMSALHWAAEVGHYDVVKLFIYNNIDIKSCNLKKQTALHLAAKSWNPNLRIINKLVAAGIDINAKDVDGTTSLHLASKEGHYMNVELLINLGCDVKALTKNQESVLHFAAKAWKTNDAVIELLLSRNVEVDGVDAESKTPLHCAAEKGFYRNVKVLLDYGANINAATTTNLTALHFAVYGGHAKIIKLLIEQNFDLTKVQTRNVQLPLYFAERNGHLKEELLMMMAATIHDKFPLLSWKRYSYQDVITYLDASQPYLKNGALTRNFSTTSEHSLVFTVHEVAVENFGKSLSWLQTLFKCKKGCKEPRTPSFIVHYPVFPSEIRQDDGTLTNR